VVGAELEALDPVADLAARRHHDDRRVDAGLAQGRAHLEAADLGQHDVEQEQIEQRLPLGSLDRRLAGGEGLDRVALAGQTIAERQLQAAIVLDEEDPDRRGHHGSTPCGRWTMKRAPWPGCERTAMVPRCWWTRRLTRLRPRPLPGTCSSRARR